VSAVMKKEMPTLLFLVGLGLLLFFLYAVFTIGMDLRETIATNRSTMANLSDAGLRFLSDNKIILAGAAAVLVVVKLFIGAPGPARS
jgi:hypothetical protein